MKSNTGEVTILSATAGNFRGYKGKTFGEQQAALNLGKDYPLVFKLNVEQGSEHKPGVYSIDPESYVTDQFQNLGMKRIKLVFLRPLDASASNKAA